MSAQQQQHIIIVFMSSVSAAAVAVVALCMIGRAGGATTMARASVVRPVPRTQIKWLINTGNLANRWPHVEYGTCTTIAAGPNDNGSTPTTPSHCGPSGVVASPNTITRLQMIHGGNTAVLVMPTGDGAHRCCTDGMTSQFSLGSVRLDHGRNNLYPVIRPFPDWRAFVDDDSMDRNNEESPPERQSRGPDAATPDDEDVADPQQDSLSTTDRRSETAPQDDVSDDHDPVSEDDRADRQRKIFNAVDAFLDDRGRILWVLDTGNTGVDACSDNKSPVEKQTSNDADEDVPPKFLAIDVQTNQIISIVSMSRVWKPKVSCFQYIVAIYPDTEINDEDHSRVNETNARDINSTGTTNCVDWPLVVVGDAGNNRLQVYLHSKDKFTEIMLPLEEENVFYDENDDSVSQNDSESKGNVGDSESKETPWPRKRWPTSPIRDILYIVPVYPQIGHSRLLITYHGCQDMYNLRLHPSVMDFSYFTNFTDDDNNNTDITDLTPAPPAPVTGTLTILGRKPCRMVILGTDRRRTDISDIDDEAFVGGGTTVYFRLENTNDIWSWNTANKRKYSGGSILYIDERDFRLIRLGRTCRVPVAVSAGPVVETSKNNDDNNDDSKKPTTIKTQQVVRQLIWMLETNFIDHFAGTTDRMGVNAKLQPIEEPLYDSSYNDAMAPNSENTKEQPPPLRVQPVIDNQINMTVWSSNRCFQRENIIK